MGKIILDLCGGTGSWSKPYKNAGYDVRVVTLPDNDVKTYTPPQRVYGILAAPPCPEFSFCRTNAKNPRNLHQGMDIVRACLEIIWKCQYEIESDVSKKSPLKFWALENPSGMLNWFLGHPTFEFQPYEYGDNYKKRTCLWGYFNEPKREVNLSFLPQYQEKFDRMKTKDIHGEFYGSLSRAERRAITPHGFAKAFFEANP